MTFTDACVCPYPAGDSTIRRMALEARDLGFDALVAMDVPAGKYSGVDVVRGVAIRGLPARETIAQAQRLGRDGAVAFARAGDNAFNRTVLAARGVRVLCGMHASDRHAFDHVTAQLAGENRIAVDISLAPILRQRGNARQKALNRYLDLLMLSRKFGFPLVISTHARSILEMRQVREIAAITSLFGMEPQETATALGTLPGLPGEESPVRVVR